MRKNIVVFSDGTGQDGGARLDARLSNVYKLYRASRIGPDSAIDPNDQIAFYDPGLGTDSDSHGFGRIAKTLYKWAASIAGRGIATNIADCYEFIINHWQPGDRIFLLGFSRGAYTARCVAQVLSLCGVPTHASNAPDRPFKRFGREARKVAERAVHQVYEHGAGYPRAQFEAERDELARRFRVEFGSDEAGAPNAWPHFIGVFDTVAALGAAGAKRYGFIAGLMLVGVAAVATVSGLAMLLPVTLFWWSLVIGAAVAVLGALSLWVLALVAGLMLALAAGGIALGGPALSLPPLTFWPTFILLGAAAGLVGLIKLRRDSYRYIDNFPQGSRRKGHHVRWKAANYDRGLSGHVGYARQAAAIDETRADFPRVAWGRNDIVRPRHGNEPDPMIQLFFAGNHSDIGGSYPEPESRLSDVALEWMLGEATAIPHPLLVERDRIQPFPDPAGMQHNEPESTREDRLFWVPRWAPQSLRQGWAEKFRVANGFPMHPSVHQRFAAPAVDENGRRQPYRPHNLSKDVRFVWYFGGSDPGQVAIEERHRNATYEAGAETPVTFNIGKPNKKLAALLKKAGASSAAGIFPGAHNPDADSAYVDALALRMLADRCRSARLTAAPLRRLPSSPGTIIEQGLLVINLSDSDAQGLARSFGATTLVAIDSSGRAGIRSLAP